MAQRVKTIEYTTGMDTTSVASATAQAFTAFTAYIPENTSRTIRSVHLELNYVDAGAAASLTAVTMSVQIDAVGASAATVTSTLTNSGENTSACFVRDVTSYFVTNFTGTSHSITISRTVTGQSHINACCKLIITYEYDDSAASTRIKTVKIPIDGNRNTLTTSLANIGGVASQLPALGTILPEASKTYRQVFFEWVGNTSTTAAAASTLDVAYNGTTVSDGSWGHTAISATSYRRTDILTVGTHIQTGSASTLQVKVTSTTGGGFSSLSGYLVVTYEYDHSTTTSVLNSIQIPVVLDPGHTGTSTDPARATLEFYIEEPGTITLVQSGVLCAFGAAGTSGSTNIACGAQSYQAYLRAGSGINGSYYASQRIDSGGAVGAGITLARGKNTLTLNYYTSSNVAGSMPTGFSGLMLLNYTSDLHASGDGVHNHTTQWVNTGYQDVWDGNAGSMVTITTPSTVPIIPETAYWLNSAGYTLYWGNYGASANASTLVMLSEVQSGEAEGAGWRPMASWNIQGYVEMGVFTNHAPSTHNFKRWPDDPDTERLNIETSRSYRYDNSTGQNASIGIYFQAITTVTHHAITFSVAGNITDSAGGTVTIDLHRDSDGLLLGTTSRTGDGAYSLSWYDNTENVFVSAYENSTHLGRSTAGVAV